MKRELFLMAWRFVRQFGYTLSEALKTAWLNIKLKAKLKDGITAFRFKKVSGEVRLAYGTLNFNKIPAECRPTTNRPTPQNLLTYFDTEKNAWRSLRCELLMSI